MDSAEEVVDAIESVRRQNNRLWMSILRIALSSSSIETRKVLQAINKNDKKISDLIAKLAADA